MRKRKYRYLIILSAVGLMYLSLFSLLKDSDVVDAQNCFRVTLISCPGAGCFPSCPNGFLSPDIVNSGFTAGVYGVPINSTLCLDLASGGTPCGPVGAACSNPSDCCTGICTGSSVAGGPLCCGPGQSGLCSGGSNALGCCASGADCPGGTCLP